MDIETLSFLTYLAVFAGGAALSFTPCVYPLVPVVIAVIGASGESSRKRNFLLSLIYVLGMALTFALLGVFAAAAGSLFGSLRASPAANLVFGNLLLLFALSVLGAFEFPGLSLSRTGAGKVFPGGGRPAVFLMGMASGVLGVPCVGPVLGAVLLFTASTGSLFAGFSLLFVFALGLGLLLLAAGAFAGALKVFARSGRAMLVMQKLLGAGMLILAQYFIFSAGRYYIGGWF